MSTATARKIEPAPFMPPERAPVALDAPSRALDPEVREVLRKLDAGEKVTGHELDLLRARMTPEEIARVDYGWGITLAQLLTPPVDPYEAPFDDEPYTPEEQALVAEALADTGPLLTSDEVKRRLGLL